MMISRLTIKSNHLLNSAILIILAVILGLSISTSINLIQTKFTFTYGNIFLIPVILCALSIYIVSLYKAMTGAKWAIKFHLGLLVFIVDASFRTREFNDISLDWQTLLKITIWLGALLIGIRFIPNTIYLLLKWPNISILLLGIWISVTSIYSYTPSYTMGGALIFISMSFFLPVSIVYLTPREMLNTICISLVFFIVCSWGVYFLFPIIGSTPFWAGSELVLRLSGLASHANILGRITAVLLALLFVLYVNRYFKNRLLLFLYSFLGIITIINTQSRTAAGALLIAIIFYYLKRKFTASVLLLNVGIISLLCYLLLFDKNTTVLLESISRSGSIKELYTFTNRTDIWNFVITKIKEAPFLGYGYGASREVISSEYMTSGGWTVPHAHNLILQSLLTTGIIGTFFLVSLLTYQMIRTFNGNNSFSETIFIYIFITGIFESGAIGPVPNTLTIIWITGVYYQDILDKGKGNEYLKLRDV